MNIKQIPPWYREAIIAIFGYVSIMAIVLIILFKPWKIQQVTPQTRASSTTTESILPPLELPVAKKDEQFDAHYYSDSAQVIEELVERVDYLEHQLQQLIVEKENKPEPKKKNWLRFSSAK